jgi:predicted Zn-dependent peptidase
VHPYGVPVVGWMSDLAALSRAQVEEYYRRFYGPSNAVVAIVGDVDPEQVTRWVHAYFGGIPPGETPPPVLAREPVQRGERRVVVEYDAEPQLRIGWHVPELFHEDAPAIGMLSALLTGGRTSRLYRRLVVQERVATLVYSSSGPGELFPNLFQINAVPRSPHTSAEVEALIYEEIARIQETPPNDADLERVRSQVEAGEVRRLDSNLGLALQLTDSESALGDWRETFRLGRRLQGVSSEDVQRVARRYFTESNRTVGTLVRPAPQSAPPR